MARRAGLPFSLFRPGLSQASSIALWESLQSASPAMRVSQPTLHQVEWPPGVLHERKSWLAGHVIVVRVLHISCHARDLGMAPHDSSGSASRT